MVGKVEKMGTGSKTNLTPLMALASLALAGCVALAPDRVDLPAIAYSRIDGGEGGPPGSGAWGDAPQVTHVIEIDLSRPGVALEVTPKDPAGGRSYRAQTTSEFVTRHGLRAAVNGAFFEPFRSGTLWGDDYYPHSGDPVDATPGPKPNGTICIVKPARVTIERGERCAGAADHALTAGPMLIANGVPESWALERARHPRTAFGIAADRRRAWMVVVDGRQASSSGATLDEMVEILRRLGASDALNLDGGGTSTMVLDDGSGARVVNSPIHTGIPGRERPGATHLGVRAPRSRRRPVRNRSASPRATPCPILPR
jgi:hypothetical protein